MEDQILDLIQSFEGKSLYSRKNLHSDYYINPDFMLSCLHLGLAVRDHFGRFTIYFSFWRNFDFVAQFKMGDCRDYQTEKFSWERFLRENGNRRDP